MIDKKPLIVDAEDGGMTLMVNSHAELKRKLGDYGLVFEPANSCLLDVVPNAANKDFVPLLGTSVRTVEPPEDSPVKREDVMKMLATTLGGRFMDLRMAMLTLAEERQRNLLATVRLIFFSLRVLCKERILQFQSLMRWADIYRRCPKCGTALKMRLSKSAAECTYCVRVYYPTFSPVAITLITDPTDEFALLVRHKGSVNGVYTCVAGFAHSGETIADCAKREIAEEIGVEAKSIRSLGLSQPWPMPDSSLMCAHHAVCNMGDEIDVCFDELESARWFSREEVAKALKRTIEDPMLRNIPRDMAQRQELVYIPPQGAIAHRLIKLWAENKFKAIK
ncbi:hypothetical protein WR25_03276 isoform B [Diploscapter pachys]|uniref:NAD(+) diphosphatase n=1 Tax=Diploscapter pachys TaxID=2018661 RepID=A0A2A2JQS5_9BILA|nr:hypothetical protein WR25_03276 isoform B [Diploscapter pachys]